MNGNFFLDVSLYFYDNSAIQQDDLFRFFAGSNPGPIFYATIFLTTVLSISKTLTKQ